MVFIITHVTDTFLCYFQFCFHCKQMLSNTCHQHFSMRKFGTSVHIIDNGLLSVLYITFTSPSSSNTPVIFATSTSQFESRTLTTLGHSSCTLQNKWSPNTSSIVGGRLSLEDTSVSYEWLFIVHG